MKLSKKYKAKLQKEILVTLGSVAIVTATLATIKLTGFSMPLEKTNKSQIYSSNVSVSDDGVILCDSIVEGVRDCNLSDGNYTFRVVGNIDGTEETKDYPVELINYYDDVTYSLAEGETTKTVSLGDDTTDYKMLVVKYHKNLTIDEGVTLTANTVSNLTYKKGMYICVLGDIYNKGNISMTARGTYNQAGENVYLWKNIDDTFEYVPAIGAQGGASITYSWRSYSSTDYLCDGRAGSNGQSRQTGGGGSGALIARRYDYSSGNRTSGAGATGTSYSGGSGGGSINTNYGGTLASGGGSANGGPGGAGYAYRGKTSWGARQSGGGAGNLGGVGKFTASGAKLGANNTAYSGKNGTGGLLVLYTDTLYNMGIISSEGSSGGNGQAGGGSSGGGSINILANDIKLQGKTSVSGGAASGTTRGGVGGTGSVTVTELQADLIYEDKTIKLNIDRNYQIEKSKISYVNQNGVQTKNLVLGDVIYEVLDKSIATVDENGNVKGIKEGSTKVKITDTTNNISTYIYIDVIDNIKVDVQEGKNFSIALKKNGTVWSYGLNTNGQLGIGNSENKTEPTQVLTINNVKQISAGYSHSISLLEDGTVYSWGLGTNGQLGTGKQEQNSPVKVDGISNIVKVDAYKNNSIALSKDGIVYVWGEKYSNFPMKVVIQEKVVDISGNLILTKEGKVYDISNTTTPIDKLSNISKISCGETHCLALSSNGTLYTWGTNNYGECGTSTKGNIKVAILALSIEDISAGNGITIFKSDDKKVYVLGNNNEGQLGISNVTSTTSITEINISKSIESISAGEGTHSSLIDEEGFIWNTGANSYGELGTGDNNNKNEYSQVGETIITTNYETKYLDLNESFTVISRLENTFNLKKDLIDDNQDNFEITLSDSKKVLLENKTITALEYCVATAEVKHKQHDVTKEIKILVAMKMESIVQGFKDAELDDGEYTVIVNDKLYYVELVNYYDDVTYSLEEGETKKTVSLGDDSTDYKMLVVKYHKNLTIDEGVTLTANTVNNLTYKKGMYICVLGNIYNNGNISMTARGTFNQEGENVYLWKNIDDTYEYVPAVGGTGGNSVKFAWRAKSSKDYFEAGKAGQNGENRQTGGGGSGALSARRYDYSSGNRTSGAGATGTSYSGGSGGGSINTNYGGTLASGGGSANGGPGGAGYAYRGKTSWGARQSGGGAGNLGGVGKFTASGAKLGANNTAYSGKNGTGGLLVLYTDTLYNMGIISSNGSVGGTGQAGGGSSGGGSVNIFARIVEESGEQTANGGNTNGMIKGGAGGKGTTIVNELGSALNYPNKSISLKEAQQYDIDENKLYYIKLNEIQTEDLTIGNIEYESLNNEIATVNETGKITAIKVGKTKIKITDKDNNYSTYIIVNVTKPGEVAPEIKEGIDFTVTLKANGTVWTFGKNDKGQLGNGTKTNSNEPTQVLEATNKKTLENIKEINACENSAIAINENGEVYIWGLNKSIDIEGNVIEQSLVYATKVEGVSNIEKASIYNGNYYVIDDKQLVYTWGKDNKDITTLQTEVGIVEMSKDTLLGNDGLVYNLSDLNVPIQYLKNVAKISAGEDHKLFLTNEGYVYSLGKNDKGQLGVNDIYDSQTPTLVRTEDYLTDVYEIAAGNKTSIATTMDGNLYVWGDNTNKKLGLGLSFYKTATNIQEGINLDNQLINIKNVEIVSAGANHTAIADDSGNVYTVGTNTSGQLGTKDNNNRVLFTRIGELKIVINPNEVNVPVATTKNIKIAVSNSFNLKTDIVQLDDLTINNTNEKELSIQKIEEIDNSAVINIEKMEPNYSITGNKIGRTKLVVSTKEDLSKDVWVNIINDTQDKVPAKVVNGQNYTVTLKADGTVWSFGQNDKGQLGINSVVNVNKPEKVETAEEIVDIANGEKHTLLLGKSGTVYSFGVNTKGQLGTKNNITYKIPVKINLSGIAKVAANKNTSFAITQEGKVYAWGESYTKVPTLLNITNVVDISNNYYLSDDGIVRSLKDSKEITLSLNEYDPSQEPVLENEKIMQISEGTNHLLLLAQSGRIYSYGKNVYGQLGDNSTNSRENNITTVVRLKDGNYLENVVEISAGDKYSIARTEDGRVYTWGINGEKQLGQNNEIELEGIQEIGYALLKDDILEVERVTAGYTHTSVYKRDGNVYTWGQGEEGQLGNIDNLNYYEAQLVGKNIVETNVSQILLQEDETFDIDAKIDYFNLFIEKTSNIVYEVLDENLAIVNSTTGELMAMQEGRTTAIAKDEQTNSIAVIPVRILKQGTKPTNMKTIIEPQVITAGSHTVMLKVDGTVWCYGKGEYGELGTGKQGISDEPVQAIFPTGTVITQIATGEEHVMALDENGNVWTWGRNNYYQLGNSNNSQLLVPTKVKELTNIKKIECGNYTSFAIGKLGEVYSFGLNANGEGGTGSYTNKITVTRAKYVTDAIDIKAGKNHTIILKSNGEVFATGSNLYGELGQNDSNIRKSNYFTKIPTLSSTVAISAGNSSNTLISIDGNMYSWGANLYNNLGIENSKTSIYTPTKVPNMKDIRYTSGGKGYSIAIGANKEIYVVGLNSSGELGNNSKENASAYTRLETIDNIIQVSAGNTYTVMLKSDGTVWATGDYTHGDEEIKSKTKAIIPIQVGNDETGFNEVEVTLGISEQKNIGENCAYAFNLISLEENFSENLTYTSLNEDIATVSEDGIITGKRVGTTRINAKSSKNEKTYSILVKIVPEQGLVAPKVEAGENFAAILKSDGSIWTFGYNSDGRLGTGNNLTRDIPSKTNILVTYKDLKVGNNFIIALRSNGTVWSVGNNSNGQLGDGTTISRNKLSQIQNLEGITKIATGKDFAVAMDNYGIIYVWGNNHSGALGDKSLGSYITLPTKIIPTTQKVVDIDAGNSQTVFVTAKGNVFGYGTILNGILNGIENAIKVEVTNSKLIILTADNKIYEYKEGKLAQVSGKDSVIDISASNETVMYQTVDEKTYVSGENTYGQLGTKDNINKQMPVEVYAHGDNTYAIGAGQNNTYIIENEGNVYAAGNNEYGSIGNGTRQNKDEHTLVGDRTFKIDSQTAIMSVGDVEEITIEGNTFNVFNEKEISTEEYTWKSDNNDIVLANEGKLTAKAEGTAHITITDKLTKEKVELTRIVTKPDLDRIENITVNKEKAELQEDSTDNNMQYHVKVITNENTGDLQITTKNSTDRISIDNGISWSNDGSLSKTIDLPNKVNEIPITIGIQNNNGDYELEVKYTLFVEKITDDISLNKVTVTSQNAEGTIETITAVPINLTRYEVAVDENTQISTINAIANSGYSYISIDGKEYSLYEQTKDIKIESELNKEVKIVVKSEAGTEVEYTLVIYQKSELTKLNSLTVNEKDATKVSEGVYAVVLEKDSTHANIVATANSSLVNVNIANNYYLPKTNSKTIQLESNTTVVIIKLKTNENEIKEYLLYIYKEQELEDESIPKLYMLIVNGKVIEAEEDGKTYISYLPSAETEAVIRAISKESTTKVKIGENEEQIGESEAKVSITKTENIYNIKLTKGEISATYKLIIRKAEGDSSLDKIYVTNGEEEQEAKLISDNNYLVKVPNDCTSVDVTAIASYAKAKVQVSNTGIYVVKEGTQKVNINENTTTVEIKVQSEDSLNETQYKLTIQKMSNNTNIDKIQVDGEEVTLGTDGNYHYTLLGTNTSVNVYAKTQDESPNVAWIKIENTEYSLYEISKQIDIVSKQTIVPIRVKAEDGTTKEYTLAIEGLPDDTNIERVTVNGKQATYIEGQNRYEIRSEATNYDINVVLSDLFASMELGTNPKAIGTDNITVTKSGEETLVNVKVTSQNGLETEEYTIAILEKSNNANIDTIKVNGKIVTPDIDGNYKVGIKDKTTEIAVEAIAEDVYATTTINGNSNSSYIANIVESTTEETIIYSYTIVVTAEDGTQRNYELKVERLEENTNIASVKVGKEENILENALLKEDGTYYYKIDRVDNAYVSVETESTKATVNINGEILNTGVVELQKEITSVPIKVIAEDGTIKVTTLTIEKKSSDASIKEIVGEEIFSVEKQEDLIYVYVNEDASTADITITTNSELASLKLESETEYTLSQITRTLDLSETTSENPMILSVDVKAEDNTQANYQIYIYKQANLNLLSVSINTEIVEYDEENNAYEKKVANGNKPIIEIIAENSKQTVQLLDLDEKVLATGTGKISTTQTLFEELQDEYIIKVISHNGEEYGSKEYNLRITQKSTKTGISYIKVDGLGTTVSEEGLTYSSTVSGKEEYLTEIKLEDENAKVRIEDLDGNVLYNDKLDTLIGNLAVPDGETKQFAVIVTSENGEEKTYKLNIERISSNLDIASITVTDYDLEGTDIITKDVTSYEESTKTYKVIVNKDLEESKVTINTISSFTKISIDSAEAKGTISQNAKLNGIGTTKISIKLTAADGSTETRYLDIVQLSNEIGIKLLEVDDIEITANEVGNYETTVTDEKDLAKVKVVLPVETSKVSINGQSAEYEQSIVNVSKEHLRKLEIPIKVTAEDGTSYTYTLTLNVISHDTSVKEVNVDNASSKYVDGKYMAYIDKNATQVNIEIIAGVKYSTITYEDENSLEKSCKEKLTFVLNTSDLTQEDYNLTFKVIAEDGTIEEYTLQCIRKSEDNSAGGVYINDIQIQQNLGNPKYADGTYYKAITQNEAKIKVVANNELATVSFGGESKVAELEKIVKLDSKDKVTEIPVTITSQQGTIKETIIYIERVSDNNNIASVKVNSELLENKENKFIAYIYDTLTEATVEIATENMEANIVRVTQEGETYLDENGASSQAKGNLILNVETPEQINNVYIKVISESGKESSIYTIQIEKMSTDTTLKEVYVNGELVEQNAEGKFVASILDTVTNPKVKVIANNEFAHVRIALGDEKLHISEQNVAMSNNKQTIIPITVRSQSGITKVTYLYINKISTSVELNMVTLDDKEADFYDESTNTYRFLVDKKEQFELFVLPESDYSTLEYENKQYESSLKTIVNVDTSSEGKTLQVKVKSESGQDKIYNIEIVYKSNVTDLEYVKVNDVERQLDNPEGETYTVIIPKLATSTSIEIKTVHKYAMLKIGDNKDVVNYDKVELDCSDLTQDKLIVPVVITAADGKTTKTYNIVLIRGSNSTQIELDVNDEKIEQDDDGNYTVTVLYDTDIKIKATALNEGVTGVYAQIDINDTKQYETPTKEVVITKENTKDKDSINVPITIIAEDGTIRNSILTVKLQKGTYITGRVLTENVEGEHSATITVYRTSDTRDIYDNQNPREVIKQVQTQKDGTFKILMYTSKVDEIVDDNTNGIPDVLEEKYDIVITKSGYLTYTITDIELTEKEEVNVVKDYKLIAGDVVESGEIELDDIVELNDKYGETITDANKEEMTKYDLNEDGIVNKLDRNILKENYGKKVQKVIWIDPNAENMILPLKGSYVITSEYGTRVHPITGEVKTHSGLDIVGAHHGNILAVASGEVTYAGVQSGYGNCVEIKHIVNGETIYSFYAHLSKIDVAVGQAVEQGEVIGLEGGAKDDPNHGTSTGHHLHFELRSNTGSGNSIDPNKYINF